MCLDLGLLSTMPSVCGSKSVLWGGFRNLGFAFWLLDDRVQDVPVDKQEINLIFSRISTAVIEAASQFQLCLKNLFPFSDVPEWDFMH
jgi:hypothetical protein